MPNPNQTGGRIVAIEGPNGAGKTHVARHLADHLGATIVRYPKPFLKFREGNSLDEDIPPLPRLVYYLAGIAHLSEEIVATPGPVICDRYFASPLAFMLADRAMPIEDLLEVSTPVIDRLAAPDVTVLLTAEPSVLRQRLEAREESRAGASMRLTLSSSRFATDWMHYLREVIATRGPAIEIETTHLGFDEMYSAARDAVAGHAPGG